MTRRFQSAASASTHPLWLRWVAMCCVWLVFAAGLAQAAHVHGDLLPHGSAKIGPHSGASQAQNSGEEHCQLCQAMHSALPSSSVVGVLTTPVVQALLPINWNASADDVWQFAMFSRPPPAMG